MRNRQSLSRDLYENDLKVGNERCEEEREKRHGSLYREVCKCKKYICGIQMIVDILSLYFIF